MCKRDAEYAKLWKQLVPAEGPAETPHGELLRAVGRVHYDCRNNGGWNLFLLVDLLAAIYVRMNELLPYLSEPRRVQMLVGNLIAYAGQQIAASEPDGYANYDEAALEQLLDAAISQARKALEDA